MNKAEDQQLLLVVGMHRSGTSAVSHALEKLGYCFGQNLLEGMESVNEDGFWEDKEVVALNQHIFELLDSKWFDFERLPGKWWESDRIKELIGVAETWFYENFSDEKLIAVKDPRFCRLLPFWKRVFNGLKIPVKVLFVYRHPVEVAASLKRRDGFPMSMGYLLWLTYVIDALYYSRNQDLVLLSYEKVMANPLDELSRVSLCLFDGFCSDVNVLASASEVLTEKKRHQKASEIITRSFKEGDIRQLADELHDELLSGTVQDAKNIADKYRKRLYRYLDHHAEILSVLQEEVCSRSDANLLLSKIGSEHDYALKVIGEKDNQLEENKEFIARCLAEIKTKDEMLAQCRMQAVSVDDPSAATAVFSEKYDQWIAELGRVSEDYRKIISEMTERLQAHRDKIEIQERGLAENQEYIRRCEARIAEQDEGLAENRGYIRACEERIRTQDDGLAHKDMQLEERQKENHRLMNALAEAQAERESYSGRFEMAESLLAQLKHDIALKEQGLSESRQYIAKCESRIRERDQQLESQMQLIESHAHDLSEARQRLLEQETGLAENRGYIVKCEARIAEQDVGLRAQAEQLRQSAEYIGQCEARIRELDLQLETQRTRMDSDATQLAESRQRIIEQDIGLAENRGYIAKCEARISELDGLMKLEAEKVITLEQDSVKQQQDFLRLSDELEAACQQLSEGASEIFRLNELDKINRQRLALQKQQMEKLKAHAAAMESELVALRTRYEASVQQLERYRSYRVVKAIDKFFPEAE